MIPLRDARLLVVIIGEEGKRADSLGHHVLG